MLFRALALICGVFGVWVVPARGCWLGCRREPRLTLKHLQRVVMVAWRVPYAYLRRGWGLGCPCSRVLDRLPALASPNAETPPENRYGSVEGPVRIGAAWWGVGVSLSEGAGSVAGAGRTARGNTSGVA